jgi:hypothetical protein
MGRQGKAITLLVPSDLPKWRRMARSLGQTAELQRLAMNEEAIVTIPLARPEASVTQEHEQNDEQRPVRDRKHSSPGQERSILERPKHDSHTASGAKRRRKDSSSRGTPAWQPEGYTLPERPYSGKARNGRRIAGKQSGFGRTTSKHKVHSFADSELQYRTARRKPRATPAARARQGAASNRPASR